MYMSLFQLELNQVGHVCFDNDDGQKSKFQAYLFRWTMNMNYFEMDKLFR
ncbi:hypothetical protein HanIR_Chr10g0480021 [Helianthus annuus]|nr:hypothetical protein HanIR_Chr10g0480021 [Helianthus annuus]